MIIFATILCLISINYLQKSQQTFLVTIQLFLIFVNCMPRISKGILNCILEIGLHIYLQDLARDLDIEDNLAQKIILLEFLGYFQSSFLEFAQIYSNPNYKYDFLKYLAFYTLNTLYVFVFEGETIRIIMISFQVFIFVVYLFNYYKNSKKFTMLFNDSQLIYPMDTMQFDQLSQQSSQVQFATDTFLVINSKQIDKMVINPSKQLIFQYILQNEQETFIMYYSVQKLILIKDKANNLFKILDDIQFKEQLSIPNANKGSFLAHKSKPLLAIFSDLSENQPGTLINVYNLLNGSIILNFGLTHKVTEQNSLHLFDSFQVDTDIKADKIIFNHNKILCCLDIDSKNNEYLTENYQQESLVFKANQRKIIVSGKDDFPSMFDVPTNQPVSMNCIFSSYSKIFPIEGLNDFYLVQPSCVKKMLYLMKGYQRDIKKIAQIDIGKPKINQAIYAPTQKQIFFVEKKTKKIYKYSLRNIALNNDESQFKDSIIMLD